MAKRVNPNLAKIHRAYTVEEVAYLYSVHKNTVRSWIKGGLIVITDKKPLLILGSELKVYLQSHLQNHEITND
jgi:DNA-binding transcriptional MerR regulator